MIFKVFKEHDRFFVGDAIAKNIIIYQGNE